VKLKWRAYREYTVWKLAVTLSGEGISLRLLFCQAICLSREENVNWELWIEINFSALWQRKETKE